MIEIDNFYFPECEANLYKNWNPFWFVVFIFVFPKASKKENVKVKVSIKQPSTNFQSCRPPPTGFLSASQ